MISLLNCRGWVWRQKADLIPLFGLFCVVLAAYYVLEGSKNGALQIYPKLVESLGELEFKYFAVSHDFRRSFGENMQKLFMHIERRASKRDDFKKLRVLFEA